MTHQPEGRETTCGVALDSTPVFSLRLYCMTKIEESLRKALSEYERDLVTAGKRPHTIHTYVDRAERFIKYLVGEYQP